MYIHTQQIIQILILLFFTLSSISANAEKHVQRFSSLQLGTEEGLNSLRVFSIATDKSGAIWMATLDGINRFNGRSMKSYQLGTNQKLSVNPEKPDVPLNKNDAFQKVQKRRVQEKR